MPAFRIRVLNSLKELLETCPVSEGSLETFEGKVFIGRNIFGDSDPVPLISIIEPPAEADKARVKGPNPSNVTKWELIVQGIVRNDPVNPTFPAYESCAEVVRVLAGVKSNQNGWNILGLGAARRPSSPNNIADMFIGQPTVSPPNQITQNAFFWVPLTFEVVERYTSPYD